MARFAYMRIDKNDKDSTRQALLLDDIGGFERIYLDNFLHSAEKNPLNLTRLLNRLEAKDVIFVASADRVCGSASEFVQLVDFIKDRGADFVCLDIAFDTRSSCADQVIRALKQLDFIERRNMSQKKKEGIKRARQRGIRVGRPRVSVPPGCRDICEKWSKGEISAKEAMSQSGLKSTSFYKKAGELGFKSPNRKKKTD